jgi:Tfp pilus assembly protein PilF
MTGAGEPGSRPAPDAAPQEPPLHAALEGILERIRQGDIDGALAQSEDAARRFPEAAEPPHLEAYLHQLKGDHARALGRFERAGRLAPDNAEILNNHAASLNALGRFAEAEERYRAALRLEPANALAHYNLGDLLLVQERPAEALARARSALETMPGLAAAHRLMGFALEAQGRYDEALQAFRASAVNEHERPEARLWESLARLRRGEYGAGWDLYEARLEVADIPCLHERFDYPRWRGASLAGRTLLVQREQGIGDEIMFASCLPDLLAVAGRCIVTCEPRLQALFARAFPAATFVSGSAEALRARLAGERIDFQIPAGSLPAVFRQAAADFPRREAYLVADPARVDAWRARLAALGPGPKIGLAWRGGGLRSGGQRRSIGLQGLAPLLDHAGAHWISLQHDRDAAAEVARLDGGARIAHWPEVLASYDETAALVTALDLTLSVCGSVVHLCGALGRPGWVMVPWHAEWRYGERGEAMPWYPSLRLLRQPAYGDWPGLVARLRRDLQDRWPS